MKDRTIAVPRPLWELHGPSTRLSTLLAVYLAGLSCAGLLTAAVYLRQPDLAAWRLVLLWLLTLDLAGGAVANLSSSTDQYYQGRPNLRTVFLLLHLVHPALLALVFPRASAYFAFLALYTLPAALVVERVADRERQQNLAALLVALGVTAAACFPLPLRPLLALAPLFMLKLVLGFAVRRPEFGHSASVGEGGASS